MSGACRDHGLSRLNFEGFRTTLDDDSASRRSWTVRPPANCGSATLAPLWPRAPASRHRNGRAMPEAFSSQRRAPRPSREAAWLARASHSQLSTARPGLAQAFQALRQTRAPPAWNRPARYARAPCSVSDQNSRPKSLSSSSARRPGSDAWATASGARVQARATW